MSKEEWITNIDEIDIVHLKDMQVMTKESMDGKSGLFKCPVCKKGLKVSLIK